MTLFRSKRSFTGNFYRLSVEVISLFSDFKCFSEFCSRKNWSNYIKFILLLLLVYCKGFRSLGTYKFLQHLKGWFNFTDQLSAAIWKTWLSHLEQLAKISSGLWCRFLSLTVRCFCSTFVQRKKCSQWFAVWGVAMINASPFDMVTLWGLRCEKFVQLFPGSIMLRL